MERKVYGLGGRLPGTANAPDVVAAFPALPAENIVEYDPDVVVPVEQANADTLTDRARTAMVDNRTFLAVANPTNAQNAAQVKALTRQVNGLIRLVINQFDATD